MSIKKVLICVGDSYTAGDATSWPEFLWDIGGFDSYVKVAKGGASNDWIFNAAYDAINEYGNDLNVELTVVVLWSDVQRINFFDTANKILRSEYEITNVKSNPNLENTSLLSQIIMDMCKYHEDSPEKTYSNILTYTYRKMHILEEYCHLRNIKLYHGCIFNITKGINIVKNIARSYVIDDETQFMPSFTRYKIELEKNKLFMGFDFSIRDYIIEKELIKSKNDVHPNDEGQKEIAKLIFKFMNDRIRPELKKIKPKYESDFIYD